MSIFLKVIDFLQKSYFGGFLLLAIGIVFLIITKKNINKKETYPPTKFDGFYIGVCGVILGVIILINKILGNW
jgi:hypothetical protein